MARGWESKSVEEQQSEFNKPGVSGKARLSEEARRRAAALQSLQLQRAHVAQEIEQSQNPRFRELKRQELAYLDGELSRLRTSQE